MNYIRLALEEVASPPLEVMQPIADAVDSLEGCVHTRTCVLTGGDADSPCEIRPVVGETPNDGCVNTRTTCVLTPGRDEDHTGDGEEWVAIEADGSVTMTREPSPRPPVHDVASHAMPEYRCAACRETRWRAWHSEDGRLQLACWQCYPARVTVGTLDLFDDARVPHTLPPTIPPAFRSMIPVDPSCSRCQLCNGRHWRVLELTRQGDLSRCAVVCHVCWPPPPRTQPVASDFWRERPPFTCPQCSGRRPRLVPDGEGLWAERCSACDPLIIRNPDGSLWSNGVIIQPTTAEAEAIGGDA